MTQDRKNFATDSSVPSSISRGTIICDFNQLLAGSFTYEGFNFTAASYGASITCEVAIDYAVTPPIYIIESSNGNNYAVDDHNQLILVVYPGAGEKCLRWDTDSNRLLVDAEFPSDIERGEVISNLTGTEGSTFTWEGYLFTEGSYGGSLTSVPAVTDI